MSAPAQPAQALGQGFDQQRHAIAFVAMSQTADGEQGVAALGDVQQVVRGVAVAVEPPGRRKALAGLGELARAVLVVIEELMSSRIGSCAVGIPAAIGLGVNTGLVPP